jgi:hypothetical protein
MTITGADPSSVRHWFAHFGGVVKYRTYRGKRYVNLKPMRLTMKALRVPMKGRLAMMQKRRLRA